MEIELVQSWRLNQDKGYKAFHGFLLLTPDEVIHFIARSRYTDGARSASAERPNDHVAHAVTTLLNDKAKRVKRYPRSDVASLVAAPQAKQILIEMHDGAQHAVKPLPFPEELQRVVERFAAGLFGRVRAQRSTVTPKGSIRRASLGPAGFGLFVAVGLIAIRLIGGESTDGRARNRALQDAVQSETTQMIITIAVAIFLVGAALSFYLYRRGYDVVEWGPDHGATSEAADQAGESGAT